MQLKSADSWPQDLSTTAIEFQDWDQDIFMHVAMKIMSMCFEKQGLQVESKDGIRVWQMREKTKALIEKHSKFIGTSMCELIETAQQL